MCRVCSPGKTEEEGAAGNGEFWEGWPCGVLTCLDSRTQCKGSIWLYMACGSALRMIYLMLMKWLGMCFPWITTLATIRQGAFYCQTAMLLLLLDGIPLSQSHQPFYLLLQHVVLPTCTKQGQAEMNTCMNSSDHCTIRYLSCRSTAHFSTAI